MNDLRSYLLETEVVIHAGGLSERWFPVTQGKIPKPLTEVGKKKRPMIDWTILPYVIAGVKVFYVTLWHNPQPLIDHFKDIQNNTDLKFVPLIEPIDRRMGRAGVLKFYNQKGQFNFDKPILSLNSDDIIKLDVQELAKFQFTGLKKYFFATVVGSSQEISPYGRIKYNPKSNEVATFVEKPSFKLPEGELANTGIFYIDSSLVSYFKEIKEEEFPVDLERSRMMQDHIVKKMRALDLAILGKTWFVLNNPQEYKTMKDFDFEKFFGITSIERYLGDYRPTNNIKL